MTRANSSSCCRHELTKLPQVTTAEAVQLKKDWASLYYLNPKVAAPTTPATRAEQGLELAPFLVNVGDNNRTGMLTVAARKPVTIGEIAKSQGFKRPPVMFSAPIASRPIFLIARALNGLFLPRTEDPPLIAHWALQIGDTYHELRRSSTLPAGIPNIRVERSGRPPDSIPPTGVMPNDLTGANFWAEYNGSKSLPSGNHVEYHWGPVSELNIGPARVGGNVNTLWVSYPWGTMNYDDFTFNYNGESGQSHFMITCPDPLHRYQARIVIAHMCKKPYQLVTNDCQIFVTALLTHFGSEPAPKLEEKGIEFFEHIARGAMAGGFNGGRF